MASKSCVDMPLPCAFCTAMVAAGSLVCLQCGAQRSARLVTPDNVAGVVIALGVFAVAIFCGLAAAWLTCALTVDGKSAFGFVGLVLSVVVGYGVVFMVMAKLYRAIDNARASKVRWERGGHAIEVDVTQRSGH